MNMEVVRVIQAMARWPRRVSSVQDRIDGGAILTDDFDPARFHEQKAGALARIAAVAASRRRRWLMGLVVFVVVVAVGAGLVRWLLNVRVW